MKIKEFFEDTLLGSIAYVVIFIFSVAITFMILAKIFIWIFL